MKIMSVPSYVYIRNVKRTCLQLLLKYFEPLSFLFFSWKRNRGAFPLKQNLWCDVFRFWAVRKQSFNERAENWSLISLYFRRQLQRFFFRKSLILFTLPVEWFLFTLNLKCFCLLFYSFYSVEHLFIELSATVMNNIWK